MTDGEELICVGNFQFVEAGETLELSGNYVDHPVYGNQLKVEAYHASVPDDTVSMERYLGSGAIKGIGEALASRIVKKFGNQTFRIIEEEPERLAEVKGISERKAQEIAVQIIDKKEMREAFLYLQRYGISNTLAVKIYKRYGMNLYGVMQENPYRLAEDIDGVGFRIADEIASRIGINRKDRDSHGFGLSDQKRYSIYAATGIGRRAYLSSGGGIEGACFCAAWG